MIAWYPWLNSNGGGEHRVEQHGAAGFGVLRADVFRGLWLMPPSQGMKIIAVGTTRAM